MRITDKGKAELARIQTLERPLKAPKRWDARWRIVIFDVPERKRTTRNRIRELVRKLGFMRLQDSVWVYPYDCEEVVAVLKADLKVGREVLYLIADAIEFDRPLRQRFGLPLTT
jgi:DNA-binding transcriptional regulator PaaX